MVKPKTRYKQIALDLAIHISEGNILEGSKIRGRSVLSSSYNVSPETIRKAMALLEDMEVVKSIPGSGSIVLSKVKAKSFIEKYEEKESQEIFKNELKDLLSQKALIDSAINKKIDLLLKEKIILKDEKISFPLEQILIKETEYINKRIVDSNFWNNTGGTIIAIKREGNIIISPNPVEVLQENDTVIVVKKPK